jgi:hypothetical protein
VENKENILRFGKKKNINMIEDAKPGSSANFLFQDIKPQLERN